jgi:hypothetical protein
MLASLQASRSTWLPVFLVAFVCYILTCSPSVNGGDSGELINAIWTLGVAHPPGYPLFTMTAHLFAKILPWGEVGFRINLYSGLCNAAAAALLTALVHDITKNRWGAWFTGILIAFSPLAWKYSVITEVFGLNQLLISAFLFLYWHQLSKWEQTAAAAASQASLSRKEKRKQQASPTLEAPAARISKTWMLLCFVAGLGASHHHTAILIAIPLLLYMIWLHQKLGGSALRAFAVSIPFGFLGMSPYAYIVIAAQSVPKMAWGNTSNWDGFLIHFLRTEYGTFQLGNELTGDAGRLFYRLWHFVQVLPAHTFLGTGVIALILAFRKPIDGASTRFLRSVGGSFAFATLFFSFLANLSLSTPLGIEVQSRFWLLPLLFVSIAAGIGVRLLPYYRQLVAVAAVALICWGFVHENQHENRKFENFGIQVLESLPKNSILFFEGDHTFGTLYYAQNALGIRRDVDVIHLNFLSRGWSRRWSKANYPRVHLPAKGIGTYGRAGYNLKDLVETNQSPGREIFVLNAIRPWDTSLNENYRLAPWGMSTWIVPKSIPEQDWILTWMVASEQFFSKPWYPARKDQILGSVPGQRWEDVMLNDYLNARHNFAVASIAVAGRTHDAALKQRAASLAVSNLEAIQGAFEKFYPVYWKNLGLSYRELMFSNPTVQPKFVAAWTNYLRTEKNSDPQSPALEQELRRIDPNWKL